MTSELSEAGRAALLEKYAELIALRVAARDGTVADPRPRMRSLAARFPGALRELDQRPERELRARLAELERGACPPWALISLAYHGRLRAALRLKLERARRRPEPAIFRAGGAASPDAMHPPEPWEPSEAWLEAAREAIFSPPNGRLGRWVLLQVARDSGLEVAALSRMLFGAPSPTLAPSGENA